MFELITSFGYLGIFLNIIGEVGFMLFPLPGDTLLFSSGVLINSGRFVYSELILIVFLASVTAGHIGYYIGSLVDKETLINNKYYKIRDEHLHKTEKFFERYGAWAIIFSRLIPMARNFLSQLLGIIQYDKRKFFIYNALASLIWPVTVVTAGKLLGHTFPNFLHVIEVTIAILLAIATIPIIKEIFHQLKHQKERRKQIH